MKKALSFVLSLILASALLFAFAGCKTESTIVRIGVIGSNTEYWAPAVASLAKEGIEIEFVSFGTYNLPNAALSSGEIDLNSFQHYAYLNKEIADYGYDICALGETIIAPLRLFSKKISSVKNFKAGDSIAIPSDATNGGRALRLLEAAGLIKISGTAGALPEVSDISENPLQLTITPLDASLTAAALSDYTATIINGQNALDNGLDPDSAIFVETITDNNKNYVNIIAVRTADKDNETYNKVLAAFRTKEVAEALAKVTKGAYVPAFEYEN